MTIDPGPDPFDFESGGCEEDEDEWGSPGGAVFESAEDEAQAKAKAVARAAGAQPAVIHAYRSPVQWVNPPCPESLAEYRHAVALGRPGPRLSILSITDYVPLDKSKHTHGGGGGGGARGSSSNSPDGGGGGGGSSGTPSAPSSAPSTPRDLNQSQTLFIPGGSGFVGSSSSSSGPASSGPASSGPGLNNAAGSGGGGGGGGRGGGGSGGGSGGAIQLMSPPASPSGSQSSLSRHSEAPSSSHAAVSAFSRRQAKLLPALPASPIPNGLVTLSDGSSFINPERPGCMDWFGPSLSPPYLSLSLCVCVCVFALLN